MTVKRGPLAAAAAGGGNTFTYTTNGGECTDTATFCVTGGFTASAGDSIIVGVLWASATNTLTCSGSLNGSYTAIGSRKVGAGTLSGFSAQFFWIPSSSAGTEAITCTSSGSQFLIIDAESYSHSGGGTPVLDGTPVYVNATASSSVATVGTVTTTSSSGLLYAGCFAVDSSCTAGSGFTGRDHGFAAATGGLFQDKNPITSGSQSATFGTGATDNTILGLVAIK